MDRDQGEEPEWVSRLLFRIHIFRGHGVTSRKRTFGPLDREKMIHVVDRSLRNPDLERMVILKVGSLADRKDRRWGKVDSR